MSEDALGELKAAQFMLGPAEYCEWIWRERMKEHPVSARPSQAWPYRPACEVIEISSRKKK